MTKHLQQQGGFIKLLVIFILLISTLAYFNISISSVVESKPVQAVWVFSKTVWTNFIEPGVKYFWDNVLKDFIFKDVVNFFSKANKQISNTNIKDIINKDVMNLATSTLKTN